MRRYVLASMTIAALAVTPAVAVAQDTGTGSGLKGPPNAGGYKDAQGAAPHEDSSTSAHANPDDAKIKGPPNADGAARHGAGQ